MPMIARAFVDLCNGICTGHIVPIPMTGQIIQMDPKIFTDGSGQAETSFLVKGACGHTGVLILGSTKAFGSTSGLTRQTDMFTGTFSGTVIIGSAKAFSG